MTDDRDQWRMGERVRRRSDNLPLGKRHTLHDPNAPGGVVVCFCPIARDHDVTAFHEQANTRRRR